MAKGGNMRIVQNPHQNLLHNSLLFPRNFIDYNSTDTLLSLTSQSTTPLLYNSSNNLNTTNSTKDEWVSNSTSQTKSEAISTLTRIQEKHRGQLPSNPTICGQQPIDLCDVTNAPPTLATNLDREINSGL